MTKIFATGATGYIGGDALFAIAQAHPEYDITCLVRNSDKGALVAKDYASSKLVYGDLDSVDLIEAEAKKADIVLNFASADHEAAVKAMLKGVAAHDPTHPGFYIHTSGTGLLLHDDISQKTYGEASSRIYDDLANISAITSFPDAAPHRVTDKLVLASGSEHGDRVKVAVVCPPTIYGTGRGPDNKRSHQVPELARVTLEKGHGVQVGKGETLWSNVHVHDLSDLYVKLVENAAAGESLAEWPGKPALWGKEGYYFAENGEHVWGDISRLVAKEAKKQGYIKTDEVKTVSSEEASELTPFGQAIWGANSRSRAKRAREVLRWEPKGASLEDEIKASVEWEARKLGVEPGHAKVAAGDA
ncbi:uncharacterized protein LTR77_001735 [Saxophila tyrrhenica]|uniref:NAD-dependent epimerase/dehydratase domain-containing protein n=1 Tax=Saxophila tyrrhenica TaxID=1690608 RepID=A0AAV9PNQ3_9PEZI|nr:hypothetical protein LTR77_001735 [Saxophila tyrrhenica]